LLTHARTIQIPEVAELDSLHLDFQSISDIYLNKIKMWNHPNLTALNPSLNLPNQTITVFYISVPSVVMQVLSMTLSQTVPEWNERVRLEFPG
jgi:phosphate transport system substrate-binding protein